MLYGGNSWNGPRDDAARIIDVFRNSGAGGSLMVGIGRPQALYVLYPHEGREVLCLGAVLPYYEFRHPDWLDDEAWRALLGSDPCPAPPEWTKPIRASKPLERP